MTERVIINLLGCNHSRVNKAASFRGSWSLVSDWCSSRFNVEEALEVLSTTDEWDTSEVLKLLRQPLLNALIKFFVKIDGRVFVQQRKEPVVCESIESSFNLF